MLNSDGLTDYVRSERILEAFNTSLSLEEHGEQLIQLALNHDSKDNISVLIAAIEGDHL